MNSLTRIDPIEHLFPEMFRRLGLPARFGDAQPGAEIRMDVTENDKAYQVRAEIPGAKKEDIRVSVDGKFVSISAEYRRDKEEKSGDRVVLKETYRGSASRGFTVAHDIDAKSVVARLEDGVLLLTLPKSEGRNSRMIEIQ